jgi:hypothetical protein
MTKSAAGAYPPPPSPLALPRKSFDLAYVNTTTEHRRSSSDAATPTQSTHFSRPLLQAVSVQDLKHASALPLPQIPKQQVKQQHQKHSLSSRSPVDSQSRQSPSKAGLPRKKTSNPNLLGLQSDLRNKMHRLAPTTSLGANPSASTLSLPASTLSSALTSNSLSSLAAVENRELWLCTAPTFMFD